MTPQEVLERRHLTETEAAAKMQISRGTLHQLLTGQRPWTKVFAGRFVRATGIRDDFVTFDPPQETPVQYVPIYDPHWEVQMEHLPEYNLEPRDTPEVPMAPVTVKLAVWLDVELPDRGPCPQLFQEDVGALCREVGAIVEKHSWRRPFVSAVVCEDVLNP